MAKVWVLTTYHGSDGDDVTVFASEKSAQSAALGYLEERWPRIKQELDDGGYGSDCPAEIPDDYQQACEWAELCFDCYGENDLRFELVECEVLP